MILSDCTMARQLSHQLSAYGNSIRQSTLKRWKNPLSMRICRIWDIRDFCFFCIANRPSWQKILKICCSVILRLSGSGTYPSHVAHPEAAACGAYPDINSPDGIKELRHGHAGVPAIEPLPALDPEDQLKVL